jgi:predicted O-methyltransferase YrrM
MKYFSEELSLKLKREHLLREIGKTRKKIDEHAKNEWGVFLETVKKYSSDEGARLPHLRLAIPLYVLCRYMKPRFVVETGVQHGFSTLGILTALSENGSGVLYSIDILRIMKPKRFSREVEVGWLVPHNLRSRWRFIVGRSQDKLPDLLHELGEIDIFLHDSEHTYDTMMFEYEIAHRYLRVGGIMMSDDIDDPQGCEAFSKFIERSKMRVICKRVIGIAIKS